MTNPHTLTETEFHDLIWGFMEDEDLFFASGGGQTAKRVIALIYGVLNGNGEHFQWDGSGRKAHVNPSIPWASVVLPIDRRNR